MMRQIGVRRLTFFTVATPIGLIGCAAKAMQHQEQPHTRPDPSASISPPLHKAIEVGDDVWMKQLIQEGADVNEPGPGSQTPIIIAAFKKNEVAIELLLKHGANPKAADLAGMTALHYVLMGQVCGSRQHQSNDESRKEMEQRYLKIVEALVNAGAPVDARSQQNLTPLHIASQSALPSVVSLLLSHKADVNARDTYLEGIPLHYLIYCDRTGAEDRESCRKTADLLVANCTDLKAKNRMGETPLQAAANYCNKEVTEAILASGGKVKDQIARALKRMPEIKNENHEKIMIKSAESSHEDLLRRSCAEIRTLLLNAQASK